VFKYLQGDKIIWGIVIALTLISMLVVYSATESLAYKYRDGNTEFYVLKHFGIILFGLVLMFLCHKITYTRYSRIGQILLWASIPLLLITMFYGAELNYARRWIELPVINLTFQPADLAKLAMIMYTARVLTVHQNSIKQNSKAFFKIIVPLIIICILIAPADLSSATLLFFTCLVLMFIGRVKTGQLITSSFTLAFLGIVFIALAAATGYSGRIETWKNRIVNYIDNEEEVWQAQQSEIAIASGGLLGKGPGHSEQSRYLPHPYSDLLLLKNMA